MIGWDYYVEGDGSEQDSGPSIEEMAHNVASGRWCQDCGCQFTREHGEPVSCTTCVNERIEAEVKEVVVRARHPEANRVAHATEARARKARRAK